MVMLGGNGSALSTLGGTNTVNEATRLVTAPSELLTTTVYSPMFVKVTAGKHKESLVACKMFVPLKRH
jgi:hypothetical protein